MAIVTVSHQHGSRGDVIARQVSERLGFSLVTPEKVDDVIRERYRLHLSVSGGIDQIPREIETGKIFANLIAAILTDMALLQDLVVFECGGQFVFRAFPNAIHTRIIAPRDVRIHNVMQDEGITFEAALDHIEEHERRQARFLRASFRRAADTPERYDLVLNTASLEVSHVADLILQAVTLRKLPDYGLVSSERVQQAKLRNQIRLARALTRLQIGREPRDTRFAHPSERVFARLLDFYGIRWEYEPRTFPLEFDDKGNVVEAFSPDFYLPDSELYVELTTMKQSLVTRKNRKVKRLKELYPEVKIRLLYQKDFEDLIFKYTAGDREAHPSGRR